MKQKKRKSPKSITLREKMEALEKRLKTTQRELRATQKAFSIVLAWGDYIDDELHKKGLEICNLFKIQNIVDEMPEEHPTLRSALGKLADQGGALPIDGKAARVFKQPIP